MFITVQSINELRDSTNVGDNISFYINRSTTGNAHGPVSGLIKGTIAKKFEHVFLLTDGRTYSWTEYYMGKSNNHYYDVFYGCGVDL